MRKRIADQRVPDADFEQTGNVGLEEGEVLEVEIMSRIESKAQLGRLYSGAGEGRDGC